MVPEVVSVALLQQMCFCFLAVLFCASEGQTKTVLFIGGSGFSQNKADRWAQEFRKLHPELQVQATRGPIGISEQSILAEEALYRWSVAVIENASDSDIDVIAHSSGTAVLNRILQLSFASKNIRFFFIDGFRPKPNKAANIICVSAKNAIGRSTNYSSMRDMACRKVLTLDYTNILPAQACLHSYLLNSQHCLTPGEFKINLDWYF